MGRLADVGQPNPFALSLSKGRSWFDRLRANGEGEMGFRFFAFGSE